MKWRDLYAEDQDAGNQKRHSLVPAVSGRQQGDQYHTEIYANKGTGRYFRVYAEVEREPVNHE